jgi:hypothetical protein
MLKNWSSLSFVLRYSAILIISALYAASTCTSPLPPSFLFTYSLSMPTSIIIIIINIKRKDERMPSSGSHGIVFMDIMVNGKDQ